MRQVIIYTDNLHNIFTSTIISLNHYRNIKTILIHPKSKDNYLNNIINSYKIIEKKLIQQFKVNKSNPLYYVLYPINIIISLCNSVQLFYELTVNDFSEFIILDSSNRYLWTSLLIKYPKKARLKTTLTIHNVDHHINFNNANYKKYQSQLFFKSNQFIVLTNGIKQLLKKHTFENIYEIPLSFSREDDIKNRTKIKNSLLKYPVQFVVPGNVTELRKPYKLILEVFSGFPSDLYVLVFLGKIEDKKIIDYANSLSINLKWFERQVSDSCFDEYMLTSHFSIGFTSKKLSYGILKASGVSFDGPKYGVPTLINNKHLETEKGLFIFLEDLSVFLEKIIIKGNLHYYLENYYEPALLQMTSNTIDGVFQNYKSNN